MRTKPQMLALLLLTLLAVFGLPALASAQSPPLSHAATRPELAVAYDYARGNAPPGGSESFNLNGGSGTLAWPLWHSNISFAADLTAIHTGNISSGNYALTLITYTGGLRYHRRVGSALQPFAQVLAGGVRASGSLVDGPNTTTSNPGLAFAANLGGGIDLCLKPRIYLRLIEADYLVTTLGNQVNNHQNNLRLSTGLVVRF